MSKIIDLTGLQKVLNLLKGKLDKKVEFSEYNKVNPGDNDTSLINSNFLNVGKWDLIKFPPVLGKHNYIGGMGLPNNRTLLTYNNEYVLKGSISSGGYHLFMGDITNPGVYSISLGTSGLKNGNMISVGGSLKFEPSDNQSKISVVNAELDAPIINTTTIKHTGGGIKVGRDFGVNDDFLEVGFQGINSSRLSDYNSVYITNGRQAKKSIQTFLVDLSDPKYDKNKFYRIQAPSNQNIFYGEMVVYKINPKWRGYSRPEVLSNITDKLSLGVEQNDIAINGILHFKYANLESNLQNVGVVFSSQNKEQTEDKIWAIHTYGNPKNIHVRGGGKYFFTLMNFFLAENITIIPNIKYEEVFINTNVNAIPYWKDSVLTL